MAAAELPLGPRAQLVRGPAALGGGARRFLHLTWLLAVTEFRLTYFGSALGYLWSLMRPLLFFAVLYVVFSQVVRFGDDIPNYPVLLLFNIVLFSFFSEATGNSIKSVVNREGIVRKMHFPRMAIPLATVLTAAFNLVLNLLAVVVFLLLYGLRPRAEWLLLPLVLLGLVLFTTGVAMLLSSLYVRFRDVEPIWSVLSTSLFYGTPVLYAIDKVPEDFRPVLLVNPLASLLEQGRAWIIDPSAPGAVDAIGGPLAALAPLAVLVGVCLLGFWVFNREAPRIAERL